MKERVAWFDLLCGMAILMLSLSIRSPLLFSEKLHRMFTAESLLFRAFVWLGRILFGVYLFHCFFITTLSHLSFHLGWLSQMFVVLALYMLYKGLCLQWPVE